MPEDKVISGPRLGGPTLQLGMTAAVFRDRPLPTSITKVFSSAISATKINSQIALSGQRNSGDFVYNYLQGSAWHGWKIFPSNPAGVSSVSLADATGQPVLGSVTPTTDAWGLDFSGRLIWSNRVSNDASTNFSNWGLSDSVTGLQNVTPLVVDPNYVTGFAVTSAGQLRWYYRPIGVAAMYLGGVSIPTPAVLASKIVAVASTSGGLTPVYRVDLFAKNSIGQVVHGWWAGGSSLQGWTVLRPGELDVAQIDAVRHGNEIVLVTGRYGGTTLGRLSLSNNMWSWATTSDISSRGVALASLAQADLADPTPSVVRLVIADSTGVVRSTTAIQQGFWSLPPNSSWTTWEDTTSYPLSAAPNQNGTPLVFAVPPGGTPVFRVTDPIFPRT